MAQQRRTAQTNRIIPDYMYGNAVPKRVAEPYRREKAPVEHEDQLARRRRERERAEKERIARRNQARVGKIDLKYTLCLVASIAIVLVSCINFLRYTSIITMQSREIAGLESQLSEMTDENVAMRERINNAVDLDQVYNVASTELGMKFADESQIRYFSSSNADYVKQYGDIPQQ